MDWNKKRSEIIRRDDYTCMRCGKKPGQSKLTVHHIKSRAQGGGDYSSNLITLCVPCHDYVEPRNFYSVADIIGSFPEPIEEPKPVITKKNSRKRKKFQDIAYRPEWAKPIKKKRRQKAKPNYKKFYGLVYELAQMTAQGYKFEYVKLHGKMFAVDIPKPDYSFLQICG